MDARETPEEYKWRKKREDVCTMAGLVICIAVPGVIIEYLIFPRFPPDGGFIATCVRFASLVAGFFSFLLAGFVAAIIDGFLPANWPKRKP